MKKIFAFVCLAAAVLSVPAAYATTITSATVYQGIPDPNDAGDSANYASTLAHSSYTVTSAGINYNAQGPASIATFLNNPTFGAPINGFDPTKTDQNIELVITGMISLVTGNNSFVLGHDDGAVLRIAGFGKVLNAPGPTSYDPTPFNVNNPGAPGNFVFTLYYSECCTPPAVLNFNVNNVTVGPPPVPEPSSIALLGTGLLSVAGIVRRRFKRDA